MGRANLMWTPISTYKKERKNARGSFCPLYRDNSICVSCLFCFCHPDGNVPWFIPMSGFVSCMEAKWLSISMTGSTVVCFLCPMLHLFFTENWHADMQMECWNKTAYGIVQKDRNSDIIIESYHLRILFSFSFINNSTRLTGSPTNLYIHNVQRLCYIINNK